MRVYSQHNKRTTTTDRTRIGIPQYNTIELDSGPLLTLSVTTVTSHQRGGGVLWLQPYHYHTENAPPSDSFMIPIIFR